MTGAWARNDRLSSIGIVVVIGATAAVYMLVTQRWQRNKVNSSNEAENPLSNPQQEDRQVDDVVDKEQEQQEEDQPLDDPLRFLRQDKWKLDTSIEQFLRDLPKVELHVHFDGSFDTDVLWKHLIEKELLWCLPVSTTLPWDQSIFPVRQLVQDCRNADDLRKLCTCRGQRSLQEMIKCFEIFLPIVRGNLELLDQLAYDFCRRQAEQRIVYTEVRYSPHLLAEGAHLNLTDDSSDNNNNNNNENSNSLDLLLLDRAEQVLITITKGFRRGCIDFGITVNQILCAITWRPDWAMHVVDLADKYRHDFPCAVVGVDIAAGEEHFDADTHPDLYQPHYDMMQRAKTMLNLNITLHAGEVGLAENVSKAVLEYGAKRIGHGYRMQPATRQMLLERQIHVEVCPTSSAETGGWNYQNDGGEERHQRPRQWHEHPVIHMLRDGLSVSINSDDPSVFDTSLCWQYRILLGKAGLTKDDVVATTRSAIHAAFCDQEEKERLLRMLHEYLEHGVIDKNASLQEKQPQSAVALRKASFRDRVRSHHSL